MRLFRLISLVLHPVAVAGAFACLLLLANLVPVAQVGIPVVLNPGSKKMPPANGALEFGWPKTARVDEIIQYRNIVAIRHYSPSHLFGKQEFYVLRTQRSNWTTLGNVASCVALVGFATLGAHIVRCRRLSLKSLFLAVTLVAVLVSGFSCGDAASKSDHLEASLSWYSAKKWPSAFSK